MNLEANDETNPTTLIFDIVGNKDGRSYERQKYLDWPNGESPKTWQQLENIRESGRYIEHNQIQMNKTVKPT